MVSSAGPDTASLLHAASQAISCLHPIADERVAHFRARYAGTVSAPSGDGSDGAWNAREDRHIRLARAAALQAVAQSSIGGTLLPSDFAVVHATCSGPMLTIEEQYAAAMRDSAHAALSDDELRARRYDSGALALAEELGAKGPVLTVVTACSASTVAIGTACDLLGAGLAQCVLAGGADAFSLTTLAGFDALKATCAERCAPFSTPVGMCLGEAGAYVVLETLEHATARGATVLGEVLGFGSSNDAYHCSAPDPAGRGPALAMARALRDAGLGPEAVAYVNAHGTGTESNDRAEARAVRSVFGETAVPVSSTKGVTGHCLGGAGALECVVSLLCGRAGVLPPSTNFAGLREACRVNVVEKPGTRWPNRTPFMSCNLAFGGNNACVVVAPEPRPEHAQRPVPAIPCVVSGFGLVYPAAYEGEVETIRGALPCVPAADCDLRRIDRRIDTRGMDRPSTHATAAAALALADASVGQSRALRADIGLFSGTVHAPVWAEAEHITAVLSSGYRIDRLNSFPYVVANAPGGAAVRALGLKGANSSVCLGRQGGLGGLALAAQAVWAGRAPAIVSVAVDEAPSGVFASALVAQYGNTEGACAMLVESAGSCAQRGVTPVAAVESVVMAFDSDPATRTTGASAAVSRALSSAGIGATAIDVVCCDDGSAETLGALRQTDERLLGRIAGRVRAGALAASGVMSAVCMELARCRVDEKGPRKYILNLHVTQSGYISAVVLSAGRQEQRARNA